jgi:hypothetical protein
MKVWHNIKVIKVTKIQNSFGCGVKTSVLDPDCMDRFRIDFGRLDPGPGGQE